MNGQLTRRIPVNNVEMEGNIWGSLKCTTTMDQRNKTLLKDGTLTYHYKSDPSIQIGVLGMIDDTLAISKCGNNSVRKKCHFQFSCRKPKNYVIQNKKSVVLHIGKKHKC